MGLFNRQAKEDKQGGKADAEAMPRVSRNRVEQAAEALKSYKNGKTNFERKIIENESWYKQLHWEQVRPAAASKKDGFEPHSAWLFNSLANKHADMMDNKPEVTCLAREESDKPTAELLTSIIPVILEQNGFDKEYNLGCWAKLKSGCTAYSYVWDAEKNGIGEISVKRIDLLNLFWEPGVTDIQDGQNFFHVVLEDNEELKRKYPQMEGHTGRSGEYVREYVYDDTVDTTKKSAVVDWYYRTDNQNGERVLQYCKFCNGVVLFSSEDYEAEEEVETLDEFGNPVITVQKTYPYRESGYYHHGRFPFVFDWNYPEEGTPVGFGQVDIMKDAQKQIDILSASAVKNAQQSAFQRFFFKKGGKIRQEDFLDLGKTLVEVDGLQDLHEQIRPIEIPQLPSSVPAMIQYKIDELKETSGNRDFSQGGTAGGVTAASAINALIETGSKLSRDMISTSYYAFEELARGVIELMRQFYTEPRFFRILMPNGQEAFQTFDNAQMVEQESVSAITGEIVARKPIFDIKVCASKKSPFSRMQQNELMLQLYHEGILNPQNATQALMVLDGMVFDGKEQIVQQVQRGMTQQAIIEQLQAQVAQLMSLLTGQPPQQPAPEQQEQPPPGAMLDTTAKRATESAMQGVKDAAAPR